MLLFCLFYQAILDYWFLAILPGSWALLLFLIHTCIFINMAITAETRHDAMKKGEFLNEITVLRRDSWHLSFLMFVNDISICLCFVVVKIVICRCSWKLTGFVFGLLMVNNHKLIARFIWINLFEEYLRQRAFTRKWCELLCAHLKFNLKWHEY